MATDPRDRLRRLGLPAGLVALALLLVGIVRLIALLVHEVRRLPPVGAAVMIDRASQLKPWPWKAPLALGVLAAFVIVVGGCVVGIWLVALRRAVARRDAT